MMSDASFKAFEDFCSPSAGTIPRKANNESSTTVFARNAETYGGKLRNKHRHAKDCLWSWPPGLAAGQDSNRGGLWRLVYCHCCLHWLELFIHKFKVHGLYIKVLFEEIKIICLVQRMKIFDGVKLTLSRKVCDENIARIAKAASQKLLGKSSLNVIFSLSCPVLSFPDPSCPDHRDHEEVGDCTWEVKGCKQGSWKLSDLL